MNAEESEKNVSDGAATISREREKLLIDRARSGDRVALRELIDLHKDRLFAFIWRMVRDHHEAEDVCQDAFLKAFSSLDSFSSEYRFSTWLFTIGYRVCLNRLRKKRVFSSGIDLGDFQSASAASASSIAESDEAARIRAGVWDSVDQLSPPQRATILLFYRNGLGCHEIARVLQTPVATVKSHLHRARARLRELLENDGALGWESYRNFSGRAV